MIPSKFQSVVNIEDSWISVPRYSSIWYIFIKVQNASAVFASLIDLNMIGRIACGCFVHQNGFRSSICDKNSCLSKDFNPKLTDNLTIKSNVISLVLKIGEANRMVTLLLFKDAWFFIIFKEMKLIE